MFTIRTIKLIVVLWIVAGAITVNAASRLWRYPAENAFLIVFIFVPFALFFIPNALAKRQFAHFMIVGLLVAAICLGIFEYCAHGQAGPEIPTMYFAVPIIQGVLVLLSSVVALIDFFVARRHDIPAA